MIQLAVIALTLLCVAYVIILTLFRYFCFEVDILYHAALEICVCVILVILGWFSLRLSDDLFQIFAQFLIAATAICFAYRMKQQHVSGTKFKSVKLDSKVYIITGSNTGLGYETALQIVTMGGTVILACRSVDKGKTAQKRIVQITKCSPTKVLMLKLDLCGFDSIRKFIKEFRSLSLPLHGLINNAGVMLQERNLTQDGFEMVFTANHLSHFLLTNLLLPELEKTNGRIVNVSSCLHKTVTKFNFEDVMSERNYSLFGTYSQSKLANVMFTLELQKRMKAHGSKVTCNAVHPGCVNTEVTRNMSAVMRFLDYISGPLLMMLRKTPAEGAYTSIHVATAVELEGIGGEYFFHCRPSTINKCAKDSVAAEKLWVLSERLTGLIGDCDRLQPKQ